MIQEKELMHIRQIRFRDGDGVDFSFLQSELKRAADAYAIPVAFADSQIRSGGVFERSVTTDCLVMFHPEHGKNYNYYVFAISRQGKYAFVDIHCAGSSKQGAAMNAKASIMSGGFSSLSAYNKGAVIGTLIGNAVGGTLFQNNKSKYDVEKNWYTMVEDILNDVFGE